MKKPKGVTGLKHPQGLERDPDGPTELRDKESSNPRDISQRANDTRSAAGTVTCGHRDPVGPGSAVTPESSRCSPWLSCCASWAGWTDAPGLPHAQGTPNRSCRTTKLGLGQGLRRWSPRPGVGNRKQTKQAASPALAHSFGSRFLLSFPPKFQQEARDNKNGAAAITKFAAANFPIAPC